MAFASATTQQTKDLVAVNSAGIRTYCHPLEKLLAFGAAHGHMMPKVTTYPFMVFLAICGSPTFRLSDNEIVNALIGSFKWCRLNNQVGRWKVRME